MQFAKFNIGDILLLKKKHPCQSSEFKVRRLGSDVRISCLGCGRDLTFERVELEKMIKKIVRSDENNAES